MFATARLPDQNDAKNEARNDGDLQKLFKQCFSKSFNTRLQGNALEPLYRPANAQQEHHLIHYAHDYFSSALHEVAHWCIAGEKRRLEVDYGYWYAPDGRNKRQQQDFERVEVKPQALEWAFSLACNIPFRVSMDNLSAQHSADDDLLVQQHHSFTEAVNKQLSRYISEGFPPRAQIFLTQLNHFYASPALLVIDKRLISSPSPTGNIT